MMLHGPSGSGKSFVALDWCMRIAGGVPEWCGKKVRPGRVVYLAGEGHVGLRARVAAWKRFHGIEHLNMWLSSDGCDLNVADGYMKTVSNISALGEPPKLIVVDTLHRFLKGDENSAQDVKTMLDACAGLMYEFRSSVLLIHHTGLADDAQHRARGSSAWKGALDVEINISPGAKGEPFQLIQKKVKDDEEQEPVWMKLETTPLEGWYDDDGEQIYSSVAVEAEISSQEKKINSKLAEFKKLFERAWFASGEECDDRSMPFVSRQKMLKFLIENDGIPESSANVMLKPSHTSRFIGYLINSEVIRPSEVRELSGWSVIDNILASSLLTRREQ